MWRNVYLYISYRLIPISQQRQFVNLVVSKVLTNRIHRRFLCAPLNSTNTEYIKNCNDSSILNGISHGIDFDADQPYVERTRTNIKTLQRALKQVYNMNVKEIEKIVNDEWVSNYKHHCVLYTLNELKSNGVRKDVLLDNPWLLALEGVRLREKFTVLLSLNGLKDVNDFVPFLRLQLPRLRDLVNFLNKEEHCAMFGNRVNYLAKELNVEPYIASKYLAKRIFVLLMPWNWFKANIKLMMKYSVHPIDILKDLWSLRYNPKRVENRLKRVKLAKRDKLKPWMIRCKEPIFQKCLQLAIDEKEVLDGKKKVVEYLAERLNFSIEETQAIMNRHPAVNRVRVPKIKEVLDYLINEAGFATHEIARTPRILCHSLETTKQRLEELKKYNCRPFTLSVVCRSKKLYEKFVQNWIEFCKEIEDAEKEATKKQEAAEKAESQSKV